MCGAITAYCLSGEPVCASRGFGTFVGSAVIQSKGFISSLRCILQIRTRQMSFYLQPDQRAFESGRWSRRRRLVKCNFLYNQRISLLMHGMVVVLLCNVLVPPMSNPDWANVFILPDVSSVVNIILPLFVFYWFSRRKTLYRSSGRLVPRGGGGECRIGSVCHVEAMQHGTHQFALTTDIVCAR